VYPGMYRMAYTPWYTPPMVHRKGYPPLYPHGRRASSMCNRSLPTIGGEPHLCATGPFSPWEESLDYAQQDRLTMGGEPGLCAEVSSHHGRRAWTMRRDSFSPMGGEPGLCAEAPSPTLRRRALSMRRGLFLHPKEESLVYAQRPLLSLMYTLRYTRHIPLLRYILRYTRHIPLLRYTLRYTQHIHLS